MLMKVVVPFVTALVMLVVGALWMLTIFIGMNGFTEREAMPILVANFVLVILAIVISSVVSGLLADVLQKRSGLSPWLAGPLVIVVVTVAANIAIFLIGAVIIGVVDSTRKRPPPPPPAPAVNRRGGGR